MATSKGIGTALMLLGAAYRAEVTDAELQVWSRALIHIDDDVLGEAADQWVRSSARFPRPAEILEACRIILEHRRLNTPALDGPTLPAEEQREVNRKGMALVRKQLAQGTLRVGTHIDDALKDEAR